MRGSAFLCAGLALLLATCGQTQLATAQTAATHQWLCAADRNGNGDATDEGEIAACGTVDGGEPLCPIDQVACTKGPDRHYACPFGGQYSCLSPDGIAPPSCSPHACIDTRAHPIETEIPIDDPGTLNDGAVDADGDCLGTIEIFGGRKLRCRPPGLSVTFQNCCKDKGKIVKDGMGSSSRAIGTKIAVAKGVFTGMKAAYTAFQAGATVGQAASAGANALIVGIDPTSIAISLAINFMMEVLLQGCDQQDMEAGMLRGSGMCHEVGNYCSAKILGVCVQKAKSHCCFNSTLGRIIQEQGRPQLKAFATGWGDIKSPECRGFTPQEFQALDFSRMDLSEYYSEIEARSADLIQSDMEERVDAYLKAVQP
ncbi:MAG: conjugal transfer protein TraN [Sphingobium sp.]|uniref:conjugal transfer protein TraN n=1 Tax=Sphingobium sp. CECT 9361 TaxID=2845384 RepID=UPI001E42BA5E|nr:conjugal transfer protein TraN [Sphingobium sp. CECT 9361]CAH0355488.1 hypothetical protein SPH9361_03567 [Sphingobium sp. CECT 9361]